MIAIKLFGGLGNQFFAVTSLYFYAKRKGYKVILFLGENPHSNRDYRDIIFKHFYDIDYDLQNFKYLTQHWTKYSEDWTRYNIETPCIIDGYFQYLPPILENIVEIREKIMKGIEIKYIFEDTVFIHVRRGDYLNNPDYHYIQDETYYKVAIKHFPSETKFKIFSNDDECEKWCKKQEYFKDFEYVDEKDEIKTLAMMIGCKGGAIISNSTFSLMAVLIGNQQKVIIPKRWCKNQPLNLFKDDWIKL